MTNSGTISSLGGDSSFPEAGELFFGLAGAIGTDFSLVISHLEDSLAAVRYKTEPVHLANLLRDIEGVGELKDTPYYDRAMTHMNAGNAFRESVNHGGALALQGIAFIQRQLREASEKPRERTAYVFRSLKHPEEVKVLRGVYGESFYLIGAYAPQSTRIQNLAERLANSESKGKGEGRLAMAHELSHRDASESNPLGQQLRKTFPLADVFVNASDPIRLRREIERFVNILFGYPYHTPSRDEEAMYHAQAAAYRSAALPRQVGAAITTPGGSLVAVGTNEVPRAGGGQYWYGDEPDKRDYVLGYDSSEKMRRVILGEVLKQLQDGNLLMRELKESTIEELVQKALPLLKDAQIRELNEFGRNVHAEMSAILDAARRGVSVQGCTLYTTTFPCHECTRHIIDTGIRRIVYNEAYPKSFAEVLHPDAIAVDPPNPVEDRVVVQPFVGIAPRAYLQLFAMMKRKGHSGKTLGWRPADSKPAFGTHAKVYLFQETRALSQLASAFALRDQEQNT